jgi:phospholipid/cholesterol/gamma-HCH transport system substrate-binding protein
MEPTGSHSHEGGLSVRDQIERYRTAFIAVVTMIVIAAAVGGYILAHENLKLPGWVPILGRSYYTLKADFQTAQAVTPGQGQAVTIAGAKIGEIQSVDLHEGVATVTMRITPKYAHFYRNATLLLRPKTQLQDITVEVNPGTPLAGKLKEGETIPQSQTAPNVDFDEFLAGLDADTRAYLQLLLAGAAEGFNHNSRAFSAVLKRFYPAAHYGNELARELEKRHAYIASSIHNFRLLMEALGGKDKQLAQLVDAANAVFATFAKEEQNLQKTLHLLPGALHTTGEALGKTATASNLSGPTLHELLPFAHALAPANEATAKLAKETTPVIKNEIRPFAREILPVVNQLGPSTKALGESFPKLATSFSVLNEFFNELAYNPGPSRGGFLFFLDWGNHNLNSVVSSTDAGGPVGRSLLFFNCKILPVLKGASEVNEQVKLLVNLLKPPTAQECAALHVSTASLHTQPKGIGGLFEGMALKPFGTAGTKKKAPTAAKAPVASTARKAG